MTADAANASSGHDLLPTNMRDTWSHTKACCDMQGVWEKDEVRRDDSFKTFEVGLLLCTASNVIDIYMEGRMWCSISQC